MDQNGKRTGNGKGQRERTSIWNVCGIKDKEPEITDFMKKMENNSDGNFRL